MTRLALASLLLLAACRREAAPASGAREAGPTNEIERSTAGALFTDVTEESGLALTTTSGGSTPTQIIEVKGGGVGLIDHDGDGDLDVFVPNGATLEDPERGPGCRLFENLGGLRFRDATVGSGLTLRRWAFGLSVGDYDGDGRDDIHVACYGPNVLYRNRGEGRFEDVTSRAGVGDPRWSTSSVFGDVDGDGDLDLYVANYLDFRRDDPPARIRYMGVEVLGGPFGQRPWPDTLWENRGDGTFRDVSEPSGVRRPPAEYGLNALILDFDADGRADILVANDSGANFLLRGLGAGRFREDALPAGLALNADGVPQASMGLAVADVDGNGRPDVYSTNFASDTNTLHVNLDGRFFADRTRSWGLGMGSWRLLGWGCGFFDLDLDGDEDLLVFNGHVYPEAREGRLESDLRQPPLLYERDGDRFEEVDRSREGDWLRSGYRARGAAFGDLDRDGDIDIVLCQSGGPLRLLRGEAAGRFPGRSALVVALRDEREGAGNPRGLGSRVELTAGELKQTRWIHAAGSFQSASAPEALFGLGEATDAMPRRVRVLWPDGHEQVVDVGGRRRVTVVRGHAN